MWTRLLLPACSLVFCIEGCSSSTTTRHCKVDSDCWEGAVCEVQYNRCTSQAAAGAAAASDATGGGPGSGNGSGSGAGSGSGTGSGSGSGTGTGTGSGSGSASYHSACMSYAGNCATPGTTNWTYYADACESHLDTCQAFIACANSRSCGDQLNCCDAPSNTACSLCPK